MNFKSIEKEKTNAYSIHYSCESLNDKNDNISPRITSITLVHFETRTVHSFAIHLEAEISGIKISEIKNKYNELETSMLNKFFTFAENNPNNIYVHWNMRSVIYGFEALQHRYQVLTKKEPFIIPDKNRSNLNDLLKEKYCENYVQDKKMYKLMELNDGPPFNSITGVEEVKAFKENNFIKLYQSNSAKAEWIRWIFYRANTNNLKVEKSGISQKVVALSETTFFKILALLAILSSIGQVIHQVLKVNS